MSRFDNSIFTAKSFHSNSNDQFYTTFDDRYNFENVVAGDTKRERLMTIFFWNFNGKTVDEKREMDGNGVGGVQ